MENNDKKDKILLVRHLGRITSWLKSYVDSFFRRMTELTSQSQSLIGTMTQLNATVTAAESSRATEEKKRHDEELKRRSYESKRVVAETARAEAEDIRVSAEADRDAAEKERARVFATYAATISDLQTRLTALESKRSIILED